MLLTKDEYALLVAWHHSGHTVDLGNSVASITQYGVGEHACYAVRQQIFRKSDQGVICRIKIPTGELVMHPHLPTAPTTQFLFGQLFPMLRRPLMEQAHIPEPVPSPKPKPIVKKVVEAPIYEPNDRRKYPV